MTDPATDARIPLVPPLATAFGVAPTPTAPALVVRPWCTEDADALVAAYRDAALRRWTSHVLPDREAAEGWVRVQERGWVAGERFGFAVLEATAGPGRQRLVGNVVLKEVAPGGPSASVGYWTVAEARGRGVAPRALEALTAWSFDTFGPGGLESLELLHQVDNLASCRVAVKSGYAWHSTLPPRPPSHPLEGHVHVRCAAG